MKWGDFVIIGAVLALAGAMLAFFALRASGDTLYAEVWQDDRLVERVELTDTTDRTIDLDGHNVIVLSGKTAPKIGYRHREVNASGHSFTSISTLAC